MSGYDLAETVHDELGWNLAGR